MSAFNIGDKVFWFCAESRTGNVYPDWLNLCAGKVVWVSSFEEIMHVYIDGLPSIHILLNDNCHIFSSKDSALECIYARLKGIESE